MPQTFSSAMEISLEKNMEGANTLSCVGSVQNLYCCYTIYHSVAESLKCSRTVGRNAMRDTITLSEDNVHSESSLKAELVGVAVRQGPGPSQPDCQRFCTNSNIWLGDGYRPVRVCQIDRYDLAGNTTDLLRLRRLNRVRWIAP